MKVLANNSILRRLPPAMDRKQILFLDGVRHAAEMIELAYGRLASALTTLALGQKGEDQRKEFTESYLYAWAVVDAIDRLRGLLHLMPGGQVGQHPDHGTLFRTRTTGVREIRNVADHLAERMDHILASDDGTALGTLSWFTLLDNTHGLACGLRPGSIGQGRTRLPSPVGKTLERPTDIITLTAGTCTVNLSDAVRSATAAISSVETALESTLQGIGIVDEKTNIDILVILQLEFPKGVS